MLRIIQVIHRIDPAYGGSAVACLELSRQLVRMGQRVSIFTTYESGHSPLLDAEEGTVDGVEVHQFPASKTAYGFSSGLLKGLRKAIPTADVVNIHGLYRFHFVAAAYLCRRYGVPYVIKPHGSLDPFMFRVRRSLKRIPERMFVAPALRRASAVHFTAEEEMHLAASTGLFHGGRGKPVFNAVTVPEGFDPAQLEPIGSAGDFVRRHPETAGKKRILFLSRLNFKKGLDILVKAFAIVCRTRDNVHLVIAGPDEEGYSRVVRSWLVENGVADKATFTGMLLGAERSSAYAAADVFVLPSYTENFGLVILESLCLGVPVVMSNKVNIWREIEEAGAGLIVDCDAGATARSISRVLDEPSLADLMRSRGRRLVREQFGWEAVGMRMLAMYQEVSGMGGDPIGTTEGRRRSPVAQVVE